MEAKQIRERQLYVFACKNCTRTRAVSFRRSRAENGLCKMCRSKDSSDKQQTLFETLTVELPFFERRNLEIQTMPSHLEIISRRGVKDISIMPYD